MIKKCLICNHKFDARGTAKYCSAECSKEALRAWHRKYHAREEWKAYMRAFIRRPDIKAKQHTYNTSAAFKNYQKARINSPAGRAKKQEYDRVEHIAASRIQRGLCPICGKTPMITGDVCSLKCLSVILKRLEAE